jgi:FKBP-type peptidyl-prolyl cis-trans isomerase FkpA
MPLRKELFMTRTLALAAALIVTSTAVVSAAELTDEQQTFYALGATLGRQLERFSLTADELAIVKQGLDDSVLGKKLQVDPTAARAKIQTLMQDRTKALAEKAKKAGAAYAAKAAAKPGAEKTASGLVYREIKAGTGESPTAASKVKVHYRGTLIDGTEFDSSYKRNTPATFPLGGVIKCWTEGLQKMKVGGKSELVCPSDIAYGDAGRPPAIPPGATLVFQVELLEIVK